MEANHRPPSVVATLGLASMFAVATGATVGCHRASSEPAGALLPVVAAVKVVRAELAPELVFQAEFQPRFAVDLHARVAGFVRSLAVDIGDHVKAGQVLAELEIPLLKEDLARAQAALRRSEAETRRALAAYDEAHLAFTRLGAVAKSEPKLFAPQDLDVAAAKDGTANASLAAAQQQVQVAQAELDRFRAEETDTKLLAPFDGVVTELHANPGDLVQGGTSPSGQAKSLVRLAQLDRLRLAFPVPVSHVALIHANDPVEIRLDGGRTILGRIARFSHEVRMSTRSMEVEVDVPNEDLSLIPGMYAAAVLRPERREHTLVVPVGAVNRRQVATVLVAGIDGTVAERPIKLGLETPERLEVLSGLSEGELVLIGAAGRVKPGQKVEPKIVGGTATEGTR